MRDDHRRMRTRFGAATLMLALVASSSGTAGCNDEPDRTAAGGAASVDPATCEPDPLRTDLPELWNGNSVDADDCPILAHAAAYGEPDAMIFKAIIYVESRFQYDAVGCTGRGPCCPEIGWTAEECRCFGLMQTGPSCSGASSLGLLPNGHPNLETNPAVGTWANSVFNPLVNIELGIAGIAYNRAQAMEQFPGCTEDQYTMMAIGNYNRYGSTESCTVFNFEYCAAVLEAYEEYSAAAGWPAHPYVAGPTG